MDRDISKLSPAERRALLKDLLKKKAAEPAPAPALTPDPAQRYEPFPVTPIQEAYLLGRKPGFAVSGVACHTLAEIAFDALDPDRLVACWREVVARHDMLRAVVEGDRVRVLPEVPAFEPEILDTRGQDPEPTLAGLRARLARPCETRRAGRPSRWCWCAWRRAGACS